MFGDQYVELVKASILEGRVDRTYELERTLMEVNDDFDLIDRIIRLAFHQGYVFGKLDLDNSAKKLHSKIEYIDPNDVITRSN